MKISSPLMAIAMFASCSPGLSGKTDFNDVGKVIVGMLENKHFAGLKFNAEMTDRILEDYLQDLDPSKLYFTKEDVVGFEQRFGSKSETRIDQLLVQERAMEPAGEIYSRFVERVRERVKFAQQIADNGKFDFDEDQNVTRSRRKSDWAADDFAAQELWRLQIAEEVLSEEMRREAIQRIAEEQGKEDPLKGEKSPREAVKQRYERYLKDIEGADEEDVASYFFSAVARAQDPHTDYMSVRQMERFEASLRNQLIGIGALLQREDDGATKIIGLVVNGPADKQGELQLNDRIVGVDSLNNGDLTDTLYMKIDHVVELIRGQQNTEVRLKVEPADGAPGEVREIVITRDKVELKDEAASAELIRMNQPDGSQKLIGWITLPSFYLDFNDGDPSVFKDVQRLVSRLKNEGVDGIALDLRGNGGGALDEVVRMTGLFIGRGPVVQVKQGWGKVDSRDSSMRKPLYDGPLIVVTDRTSASASEILAGALQDYNRAIVVGESSTYGKGTVQQPMDIGRFFKFFQDAKRAGTLKATVQKFYRVTGSTTQLEGVVPDIILPSLTDALEIGEKYQDHALPHDLIAPARGFNPMNRDDLFLDKIEARSKARVDECVDFSYTEEDIERTKKRIEENMVSLNREVRQKELDKSEKRRETRNKERRERFAKVETEDAENMAFFRLTLDDLDKDKLEEVDRQRDAEAHMRVAKDRVADLDDTPDWPSGLDDVKRESIHILTDLIEFTEQASIAQVDDKKKAQAQ